jgi:hypothetical protein
MSSSKHKFGIALLSALISVAVLFSFPATAAEAVQQNQISPNLLGDIDRFLLLD